MNDLIALTGVTGRLGGLVAAKLAADGAHLRLLGRHPERIPDLPGATTAPAADYGDADSMRTAVDGAGTLLLVSAHESPTRVAEHISAIDAAVAAGVERIVYISFLAAAADATFTFGRDHWHTEQHIRSFGIPFTFLRDSLYHAGLAAMAGSDGVIRGPAGSGTVASVAHRDVADVAVAALTEPGHEGKSYDVTGPEPLTLNDVARALTDVSGRDVHYQSESHDQAIASRAHYGAPDWEVAGWVSSYEAIGTGELSTVSDTVPRLTRHPATNFADYLAANPDSWRHLLG